jgi:hypothetical protein
MSGQRVAGSWVDAESTPVAEPAVEQGGQLAGEQPQAFTAVYARQLVEQSGRNRSVSRSQHQRRSRGPATSGEPFPQTFGILVAVERVTGTISSGCRRPWRDQVGSRGRAEPGVLGAVIGLAARVGRPADSVITSPGSGIRVIAPRLDRRRLRLDRTSRHVATEHYSPQGAASAGQMDAHCRSLSWSSHRAGQSRCSAYGPLPHTLSRSSLMVPPPRPDIRERHQYVPPVQDGRQRHQGRRPAVVVHRNLPAVAPVAEDPGRPWTRTRRTTRRRANRNSRHHTGWAVSVDHGYNVARPYRRHRLTADHDGLRSRVCRSAWVSTAAPAARGRLHSSERSVRKRRQTGQLEVYAVTASPSPDDP